jgi:ACR3 family arsenite efflux pump ArsB
LPGACAALDVGQVVAALAMVVGVLVAVRVMRSLAAFANRTRGCFPEA